MKAKKHAAACIRAVGRGRIGYVLERQVEAQKLRGIELELELRGDAAEIRHLGNPRNLLERGNDDPSLDFGEIAQVFGVGFERQAERAFGAHDEQTRGPVELTFKWNSNLPLHLL